MIRTILWNIIGIVNSPSIRRLKKTLTSNKVDICAIFEPKYSKGSIEDYEKKLNCPCLPQMRRAIFGNFGNKISIVQL